MMQSSEFGSEGSASTVVDADETKFELLSDRLVRFSFRLSMLVLVTMIGLITVDLISRNLFARSLMIVDEVIGQLTVALAFFGVPYALRQHALLRVELFYNAVPAKVRAIFRIGYSLGSILFICAVGWFGYKLVSSSIRFDVVSISHLKTPMWIPQLVIPVGACVLLAAAVSELLGDLRNACRVFNGGDER